MTALAADRNTHSRSGVDYSFPCAAAKQFYKGQIVVLDSSGNAEPGTTATGKLCVGVSRENFLSTTAAAENVKVRSGIYKFANSSGDAVTKTEVGKVVYIEDDQTVCKTATSKSVAGYCVQLDSDGVWVILHHPATANPSAALLAANDLSDVADAPTARANIAANKVALPMRIADLVGGTAAVYSIVSPVAGDIEAIHCILNEAALTVGDATITGSIVAVAITGGVVTITQAGSAVGDIDLASPSAANTVAVGDEIRMTVGGTNTDADAYADLTVYIET